ncbi:hypothetical protein [Klebsiella pneumoniae]|uniref:hypothetical protein n=21 Tax=Klebsiella/Raoultella group TaxID=2890311 RepID=UPI003A804D2A
MAKPKYSPETKLAVVNHYLSGKDGEQATDRCSFNTKKVGCTLFSVFTGQIMINHSQFCFRGILWFSHKIAPYSVGCPTFGVQSSSAAGQSLKIALCQQYKALFTEGFYRTIAKINA